MIAGYAIVAVFIVFAALMYARVLPALLAVPAMAIAMALVSGVDGAGIGAIVSDGVVALAATYATVIFGAFLGRVTIETKIAESIVNFAAEFGGDRPFALALALCAAVALLFVSLTGLGAIIMVGSIVLPILMTVGVPRKTAATLFLMAFALGFILNIAQLKLYASLFEVPAAQMQWFALALFALDALALIVYAAVRFRGGRDFATWAAAAPVVRPRVPAYALVTPVLPIVLFYVLHLNPIVAFALAALYGVLVTRPRAAVQTLVASAIRGIEDVAPAVLLMMGIGMLLVATKNAHVRAALEPVVTLIAPHGAIGYIVLFGLASPLALFRGPLNPFGVGIAVYTVMSGLHIIEPLALVAAVMAVVQVQNVCDPTNTANVWVANATGVHVGEITKLTLPFQVAVATAACVMAAAFGGALFGKPLFAGSIVAPAAAASWPGLYAPPGAARTIAFAPDGNPDSRVAAEQMARDVARGWVGYHALSAPDDAGSSDCARKPYAALGRVAAGTSPQGDGSEVEVVLDLVDCAGWDVNQWAARAHVSGVPGEDDVRRVALAALFQLRVWTREEPRLANALFERGLAYDASTAAPTYFYSLFKTSDGYMRAMVRPGGPAYIAGMRTNDIVDKLDGRFWWEYGTFQTQRRAYDGLPHVFEITRGKAQVTVRLGAPFLE